VDRSALAYVDLDGTVARRVAKQAGRVVAEWRTTAIAAGIKKTELDRMASAFEHKDLAMAVEGA
jgi:serine/threonine-protein kinase HipA